MIAHRYLKPVGKLRPKPTPETGGNLKFGIGFEKLDRNVFDPEPAYEQLAAIGVKYVRLQSGWMRTEKTPGIYDFAWLDAIVDRLIGMKLEPWLCLCYGNPLYTDAAKSVFGAVGTPPIKTTEERAAWARYVTAVCAHYRGRVKMYEVWNEPDGQWCWKHGVNGTEYGQFVIDTAKAVKAGDPDAKVLGGSMCGSSWGWLNDVLATGAGKYMEAYTYHGYCANESRQPLRIRELRSILNVHGLKDLPLIQGEAGCPSRDDGFGALHFCAWTQERQAKHILRCIFAHLDQKIEFYSHFTTVDMIEALNGSVNDKKSYLDYGYFGVLAADFDENGFASGTYTPKMSYRALQNAISLFDNGTEICEDLPAFTADDYSNWSKRTEQDPETLPAQKIAAFRRKDNGSAALVYWHPSDVLRMSFDGVINLRTLRHDDIRLVDLLSGTIYELDPAMMKTENGATVITDLPICDYPLALTFGDFIR